MIFIVLSFLLILSGLSPLMSGLSASQPNRAYAQEFTPTPPPRVIPLLPVAGGHVSVNAASPNIIRSRRVNIDFNVMPSKAAQTSYAALSFIELDLFDDAVVIGQEVRLDTDQLIPDSYTWLGTVLGDPYGEITLSVGNGLLEGFISTNGSVYQITSDESGGQIVNQLIPDSIEPSGEDGLVPPASRSGDTGTQTVSGTTGFNALQSLYIVDLMVVYTSAAAAGQGSAAALENAIQSAVAATNQAYVNSDIRMRLRLVHMEQVAYAEPGTMDQVLDNVTSGIGNVHAARDAYSADLVSFITNQDPNAVGKCGLGWVMQSVNTGFAPYGYNVVARTCLPGGRTLAHELGHNMGAQHNIQDANTAGAYSYSYGYFDPEGRFRDIMSYSTHCAYPCPTVNYFSNTTRKLDDRPIGNANANTALTLSNTAPVVSALRGATVIVAPTATPISGVITVPATPVPTATPSTCTFTIADGDSTGLINAINTANGGFGTIICLAAGGTYTFTSGPYSGASTYGSSALPLIQSSITLLGNGATLIRSGSTQFRFFYIDYFASLAIDNLSLLNGRVSNSSSFNVGGAIFNSGTTTISRGYFSDNIATSGGAIYNWGQLRIADSVFIGNSAYYGGGVMAGNGGGTTVNIQRTFFRQNSANAGAAVYAESYSGAPSNVQVTVAASCFVGNTSLSVDVSDTYPAQDIVATNNWWGSSIGPSLYDGNILAGDMLTASEVTYSPFVTVAPSYCFVPDPSDGSAPQPNYFIVDTPTLTWNTVVWAQVYEIQVSTSSTFASTAFTKNDISGSSLFFTIPTATLGSNHYYWRVRGCQGIGVGCGTWSAAQSFDINKP